MRQLCLFQRRLRVDKRHLAEIFSLGIPIGFSSFGEVGVYLLSTVIVSLFGATALAAHAITLRMAGVVYALTIGLSQAATVRVSYAVGRGDWWGMAESGWTALVVGTVFGLAIFAGLEPPAVCLGYSSRMARSERLLSPPPPRVCCFYWALLTWPSDRPHPPRYSAGLQGHSHTDGADPHGQMGHRHARRLFRRLPPRLERGGRVDRPRRSRGSDGDSNMRTVAPPRKKVILRA